MEKCVQEIKENYSKYEELLVGTKNVSVETIILDEIKGNHKNTRVKSADVFHNSYTDYIELIIESKIANKKDFKFKLRAPNYTEKPFFRFDSDGVSHYNKSENIELSKQKVDTPHFHKYDLNGNNIAYKTEALKEKTECEALINDINLCMAHYSDESQTYYRNENYVKIIQTPSSEFDFDINKENPTEGVDYD